MGRPLTGTCKPVAEGWKAELPATRGSTTRTRYTFRTEAAAQAWLHDGIRALNAARSLPLPARRDLVRLPADFGAASMSEPAGPLGTRFLTAGLAWVDEYCVDLQRAGASRETTLRGTVVTIDNWMTDHGYGMEHMHRSPVIALYKALAGHAADDIAELPEVPPGLDPDARVTFRQALALPGLSGKRSSFKRAKSDGTLVPSLNDNGIQEFRIGDLYAVAGPARHATGPSDKRGRPRSTNGYVQDVLTDKIWTFRQVTAYAREALGIDVPTDWHSVATPKSAKTKPQGPALRPVASLDQTAQVAAQMHVVHQLVLWLLRILGVRISEGFGIRVSDVIDYGHCEPGLLWLHHQGGKKFGIRDPRTGRIAMGDSVEELKGKTSHRVLVVPPTLMDLIRAVIAIFHTDASGRVRRDARLVPGLARQDVSGQAAFRHRLRQIAVTVRVSMAPFKQDGEIEAYFTPHDLRRSVLSELSYGDGDKEAQRRFAGHTAGADVHARHYLLDDPLLGRMREIASELENELRSQVGQTLMIPTPVRCTTGKQTALHRDADRIDAALTEAGWLLPAQNEDADQLLSSTQVATRLKVTEKTAREWMRTGRLVAVRKERPGGHAWMSPVSAVEAKAAELDRSTLTSLAAELGMDYYALWSFVRARDLPLEPVGERSYVVPAATEQAIRAHIAAQAELRARSMSIAEAAAVLRLTVAEIDRRLDDGKLTADGPAHDGTRMITRESVLRLRDSGSRTRVA